MRVTGGAFAAGRLPENYYGMFIKAAQEGGMAAVCATEQYQERIAANPQTRDRLMAMDPKQYIKVMSNWQDQFIASTKTEVFGMTDADLAAIAVPTVVIPGNDQTHASVNGRIAAQRIPGACCINCRSRTRRCRSSTTPNGRPTSPRSRRPS